MRQPGQTVKVLQNGVAVANWAVTQQEAAEIDSQNTAAVHGGRQGENENPAAQREQRIQASRQGNTVDHLL
ncbi:hypothetical protein D3C72_1947740 [compost metagenome]